MSAISYALQYLQTPPTADVVNATPDVEILETRGKAFETRIQELINMYYRQHYYYFNECNDDWWEAYVMNQVRRGVNKNPRWKFVAEILIPRAFDSYWSWKIPHGYDSSVS